MMRSLWTAASGMSTQQLAVDTISNNIANVNTVGFKRERVEFQSLLYETMQGAGQNPGVTGNAPANLQVGHGARPVSTTRNFTMGQLEPTGSNTDFAINGNGFFLVDRGNDNLGFTRDGSFSLSPSNGNLALVNSQGLHVLDTNGNNITFPGDSNMNSLSVDSQGNITYLNEDGDVTDTGIQMGIVQFPNKQGLESIGGNILVQTPASGAYIMEANGGVGTRSQIIQSHLERSNVKIAEEMVNLIVSQRAYELNSRIIQTSDDMLQQANNLRR